jgi:hypothetical protein
VATVRWRLFDLPGKVVRHAGAYILKVAKQHLAMFQRIRDQSAERAQSTAPS